MIKTKLIPTGLLEPNKGQIKGLPKNPRLIKDDRFKKLVKSLQDLPEMAKLRECIVIPFQKKYVIIGGNQRYHAMKELKWKQIAIHPLH